MSFPPGQGVAGSDQGGRVAPAHTPEREASRSPEPREGLNIGVGFITGCPREDAADEFPSAAFSAAGSGLRPRSWKGAHGTDLDCFTFLLGGTDGENLFGQY
jgi:hypothetical protein